MEDETDKDLALEYFDEDLKEQSEDIDEDYEFEPPEEDGELEESSCFGVHETRNKQQKTTIHFFK